MDWPDYEPLEFELPNGHGIRVEYVAFLDLPTRPERQDGVLPRLYTAIRIFTTEDNARRGFELGDELRSEATFDRAFEERIWSWLEAAVASRRHANYDRTDDFVEDFELAISRICIEGDDAVEHLEHLPEPDALPLREDDFDPADDANFNDQNEPDVISPRFGSSS